MGLVVKCDWPECETSAVDNKAAVKVFVAVSDPETGSTEKNVFYCVPHGDQVLTSLESLGITDLQ